MNKITKTVISIVVIIIVIIICIVYSDNSNTTSNNIISNNVIDENVLENKIENTNIDENKIENKIVENKEEVKNEVIVENKVEVKDQGVVYESDSDIGTTDKKQQAINLVKQKWGEDNTVTFRCDSVTTNGEYIIAVVSSKTASVKNYFIVNLENKTVMIDY